MDEASHLCWASILLLLQDVERAKQSGESSAGLSKQLAAALCSLTEMKMGLAADVSTVSA